MVDAFKKFDASEEEKNNMLGYITRAKMNDKAFSSQDTMWGPVMKAFPKRYQKSDGLQVQLWRVGARRHEAWDP